MPPLTKRDDESQTEFTIRAVRAEAWDEGYQAACDETSLEHAPSGPADHANPYRGGERKN